MNYQISENITNVKVFKKLKEIRIERRKIKDEYSELQSILFRLRRVGLHKNKKNQIQNIHIEQK